LSSNNLEHQTNDGPQIEATVDQVNDDHKTEYIQLPANQTVDLNYDLNLVEKEQMVPKHHETSQKEDKWHLEFKAGHDVAGSAATEVQTKSFMNGPTLNSAYSSSYGPYQWNNPIQVYLGARRNINKTLSA